MNWVGLLTAPTYVIWLFIFLLNVDHDSPGKLKVLVCHFVQNWICNLKIFQFSARPFTWYFWKRTFHYIFPIMHILQNYRTLKLFVQQKIFLTHTSGLLCGRHKILQGERPQVSSRNNHKQILATSPCLNELVFPLTQRKDKQNTVYVTALISTILTFGSYRTTLCFCAHVVYMLRL